MADEQTVPLGSMFSLGWLMARLYDLAPQPAGATTVPHLPTISELGPDDYTAMAFAELDELLSLVPGPLSDADVKGAWDQGKQDVFKDQVGLLHLAILKALAPGRQQLSAYQLGLALSGIGLPPAEKSPDPDPDPDPGAIVLARFDRAHLATLQTWLAGASTALPAQSAATVSRSLQNWQDWADVNAGAIRGRGWDTASGPVLDALRTQGSVWYGLLSGQTDIDGQLSVEAWLEAGQSMARTTGQLTRMILRRFWPALLVLALATAGLLYLAIDKSAGTAKVWTSLITVAAALGVTGASLRAATMKAADGLEADIEHTATLDARAWSVTWLPALESSSASRRELADRGVAAPQLKLGLEPAKPGR